MKRIHQFLMLAAVVLLASCGGGAGSPDLLFSSYDKGANATNPDNVPAEIMLSFAVPQGNDAAAANIINAERNIIAASRLAEELGAPEGSTLQAIADNYEKRFLSGMTKGDIAAPCVYQLQIACSYQNDKALTFSVSDGVYGNGGPQEYLRVVSLADGRIIEREALTTMTEADIIKLGKQYGDQSLKDFLAEMQPEDFWIAPDSAGCKVKIQTYGHFFADFTIPADNITPYLTNEGKTLFGK